MIGCLAGAALMRRLQASGYTNLVVRTHAELELTDSAAVARFFAAERPDHVFLAAARVGGIVANNTYPAEFISQNLSIQTNVMTEAWRNGVQHLLFLGSSCIYPRDCPQPIRESYLLTGQLENTARVREVRRDVARMLTIARQKRAGEAPAAAPKAATAIPAVRTPPAAPSAAMLEPTSAQKAGKIRTSNSIARTRPTAIPKRSSINMPVLCAKQRPCMFR